jgi:hypothetical protein
LGMTPPTVYFRAKVKGANLAVWSDGEFGAEQIFALMKLLEVQRDILADEPDEMSQEATP